MTESEQKIIDRLDALARRIDSLEKQNIKDVRLGTNPKHKEDLQYERERMIEKFVKAATRIEAVGRDNKQLVSGAPVPEDYSHTELKENGQQKDYVVLSPDERAKGFIRPVRRSYKHTKCGGVTTMSHAIAETYARDPGFYSGTFCSTCSSHFPIATHGQDGEFTWLDDGSLVGK